MDHRNPFKPDDIVRDRYGRGWHVLAVFEGWCWLRPEDTDDFRGPWNELAANLRPMTGEKPA